MNTKMVPSLVPHSIDNRRGLLIQDRQHTRDRTKGIDAYIANLAEQFEDVTSAHLFFASVRRTYPRYIRDQLQIISKALNGLDSAIKEQVLKECMRRQLNSATDFSDMVEYIKRQRQVNTEHISALEKDIKPLKDYNKSLINNKPVQEMWMSMLK